MSGDPDYPCVLPVDQCPNKQGTVWVCHGSWVEECYVNWASTDPDDLEPYDEYVAAIEAKRAKP